jgi:hypothetical protein
VLKTKGYHIDDNFRHREQHLAPDLALSQLLGFPTIHYQQMLPVLTPIRWRHSLQSEGLAVGLLEPAAELLQIVQVAYDHQLRMILFA